MITAIAIILLLAGLAGTILPVLPGLIFSYIGLVLYTFWGGGTLPTYYLWIFGALLLLSSIFNYLLPARLNKKYGGSRWGSIGSVIGTILGLIFIPLPLGFLIGMILGVFIAELLHDSQDTHKALQSVKGAFIGFIMSTGLGFAIGFSALVLVVWDFIKNAF
ncbi:DUF456 domain-containing protein [Elizabethkingia sp. JS20170427COW]|uniref:DUF456 domain-containing protein n=1 Tax=Elizabethkingia sp. JS20170427COW TaxID=2583851 RepID=UPI001110EEF9|nr:DUF456 domain-containing protein [Elizabethkingia sp. JS20170427COW]QCX54039.1 DUF456 domain-containing protein [Elizabethkingia sp. JS20170427COW]